MRRERKGHTLQTSALVNEAFLRLVGAEGAGWRVPDTSSTRDREFIAIDGALEEPAKMDPRKARVIELRFFGGLRVEETAEVLKISAQSVMRDWRLAKAWLACELGKAGFK
jgi:DNA-directed RNA polymerase specialized sigma24 family protein